MIYQQLCIGQLSPSAARLLLAFLSHDEYESFESIMHRSGIHGMKTYLKAREELYTGGYLVDRPDGTHAVLKRPDRAEERVKEAQCEQQLV